MSMQEIVQSGNEIVEAGLDRGEQARSERWETERRDKEELRNSLERPVADLDFPKPKQRAIDDDKGLRETLEDALEESHVNADRAERREKDLERFDLVSQQIKRSHGIEGIDAVEALWRAEQRLRQEPEAAIRHLANQYLSPNLANAAAQREHESALGEVHKFMERYSVSPAVESLLPSYLGSPAFQQYRTGDYQKDLLRACSEIQRGLGRVK